MSQISDLLAENEELKRKLHLSQIWMQRQIHESLRIIVENRKKQDQRKKFENLFESEILDSITSNIETYFSYYISSAPIFTLERLIDAEIFWHTLQQFPHMDGFPIIVSYQKILDSTFQSVLNSHSFSNSIPNHTPEKWIEYDIFLVFTKQYTLSLWRWYQILSSVRSSSHQWEFQRYLCEILNQKYPKLISFLVSDDFFLLFEDLIKLEVFQWKRHVWKVSFSDAKKTREICTGLFRDESLFRLLFKNLS